MSTSEKHRHVLVMWLEPEKDYGKLSVVKRQEIMADYTGTRNSLRPGQDVLVMWGRGKTLMYRARIKSLSPDDDRLRTKSEDLTPDRISRKQSKRTKSERTNSVCSSSSLTSDNDTTIRNIDYADNIYFKSESCVTPKTPHMDAVTDKICDAELLIPSAKTREVDSSQYLENDTTITISSDDNESIDSESCVAPKKPVSVIIGADMKIVRVIYEPSKSARKKHKISCVAPETSATMVPDDMEKVCAKPPAKPKSRTNSLAVPRRPYADMKKACAQPSMSSAKIPKDLCVAPKTLTHIKTVRAKPSMPVGRTSKDSCDGVFLDSPEFPDAETDTKTSLADQERRRHTALRLPFLKDCEHQLDHCIRMLRGLFRVVPELGQRLQGRTLPNTSCRRPPIDIDERQQDFERRAAKFYDIVHGIRELRSDPGFARWIGDAIRKFKN